MSLPTVIFCEENSAFQYVAGLSLLDRLLVAAHRAGATRITVVSGTPLPQLKRASALGITFQTTAQSPEASAPTLVLTTGALVQTADLKRVIEQRGRLVKPDGTLLPVGVLNSVSTAPFDSQLANHPPIRATGVAELINDSASAAHATGKLWASLTSSADGFVDKYFNRPAGRALFSKLLIHTPISPNQVSVAATLIGLLSAACFADGSPRTAIWGAVLLQLSAIVDCVDGDLARVLFKESPLGKWLDVVGDQIVHIGVFVCIGIGLYRAGSAAPVLLLAASAAIGVVISFSIVMRGLMQPESQRNTRLQKLIDATTNRDFSVLLLVLALAGKLEWFLWMTAIGVHVFWVLALSLQLKRSPVVATDKSIS
jgi:phosphatidylglycerophosphate synthase